MPEEILSMSDVWKSYADGEPVLRGVNVSIRGGDFVGVHGRSGSGKSTLLRLMGLLDTPTKGRVALLGRDMAAVKGSESARMRRERLGFVFQGFNLVPHITAVENIEVPMWLVGVEPRRRRERGLSLLSQFGLEKLADRYPAQLSHGEQQRVAALRALANRPRMILADEPTSSLDDENARTFLDLVSRFNREMGTTVIMTSTDPDEVMTCSAVFRLAGGVLTAEK
jgi:putative ABC transport system ATP-binding protein